MRRLILISALLSFTVLAGQDLNVISAADDALLDASRGGAVSQYNETDQGGTVSGVAVNRNRNGSNDIGSRAFSNAHGIIMVSQVSGNANITNMSSNVNIISAK